MNPETQSIEFDNRDMNATVIEIEGYGRIEVDPMELMENAIDNMPEEGISEDIRRAWKVLKDLIETPYEE